MNGELLNGLNELNGLARGGPHLTSLTIPLI
jgi:hypothetical protein